MATLLPAKSVAEERSEKEIESSSQTGGGTVNSEVTLTDVILEVI
jgi:hypothetical protein